MYKQLFFLFYIPRLRLEFLSILNRIPFVLRAIIIHYFYSQATKIVIRFLLKCQPSMRSLPIFIFLVILYSPVSNQSRLFLLFMTKKYIR